MYGLVPVSMFIGLFTATYVHVARHTQNKPTIISASICADYFFHLQSF